MEQDQSARHTDRIKKLEAEVAEKEVSQRDMLSEHHGEDAARRDGRRTPDVPDHLDNIDATEEDHIKDVERRMNTAADVDEDLRRLARGEADAAANTAAGVEPAKPIETPAARIKAEDTVSGKTPTRADDVSLSKSSDKPKSRN